MSKQPSKQDGLDCIALCAIAGPLMPQELGEWTDLAAQLLKQKKLQLLRGGYTPTTTSCLRELQKQLTHQVHQLAHELEQRRSQSKVIGCEALRGRARQALVLGQHELFHQLIMAYGGDDQLGWHPDRDRKAFWFEVMGEELRDSDLLPEGKPRNELFHLLLLRYSLSELPTPLGLPTPPYDDGSRLSSAIFAHAVGDAPLLNKLVSKGADAPLLQAIKLHHEGRFKEAQPIFKSSLGISAHGALILIERKWDIVLPIAIRNAIQAKAGAAVIECWMHYLLQCISIAEDRPCLAQAELGIARLRQEWQDQLSTKAPPAPKLDHPKEAIFWDIRLSPTAQHIEGLEARLLPPAQEAQRSGKSLALSKLSSGQYMDYCDADDLELLTHITQGKWSYLPAWKLATGGYAALSQHPRVRLIDANGTRRALRLQICTARNNQEAYQIKTQADGSLNIAIPTQVEEATQLLILAQYRAQQLTITLQGSEEECLHCLQQHPLLETGKQRAPFCWVYPNIGSALAVLHELQSNDTPLHWQGSKPLQIHAAIPQGISLNSSGKMGDWLKLGAELRINEELIYSTDELLQLWSNREGNYIQLTENLYLPLNKSQQEQLATLQVALRRQSGQWRAPRAALPSISKVWNKGGGELAPHCKELLVPLRQALQQKHRVPSSITATLRPYQVAGFEWLAARSQCGLGCCLADEMGLGKTLQMLCLLQAQAHAGRSLIIAPLSLLNNWVQEAARFAPQLRVQLYQTKQAAPQGDVMLASYGQMLANPQDFEQDWNILVLDEAQALKNPRTLRSKAIAKLRAKSRVALSATPIENHLLELWSLMHILNPGLLGSQRSFKQRTQQIQQRHALRELVAPFILRRLKKDVMQELPELTEICVGVELDEEERALYESHRRHTLEMLQSSEAGGENRNFSILRQLTLLRRLCCHASLVAAGFEHSSKMQRLVELAAELREAGHRALIFSQFTDVLQLAQKALESDLQARCLYLDGQLNAKQRARRIKQFQEGHEADFFLISLKAGGTGLNLTAADYVILLDPWWNPAIEQQAMGRAHRMGQKRAVTLCRLICHDTVEEKVLALHQDKKQLAELLEELPYREIENLIH